MAREDFKKIEDPLKNLFVTEEFTVIGIKIKSEYVRDIQCSIKSS